MAQPLLIVAHGQPSDPEPAEAEIEGLAARVGACLPGREVRGVTLASPGRIEAALAAIRQPLVFPFFMADGWFIRVNLARRLAAAGPAAPRVLVPFGLLPETPGLAIAMLATALRDRGWDAASTTLVLAAHGSGASRQPARAAEALARAIGGALPFADLRLGFIEEPPPVAEALAGAGDRALLLPLFVARWGHVETDLPAAVAAAGYAGAVLPPLGTDGGVPALIAAAARRADTGAPAAFLSEQAPA